MKVRILNQSIRFRISIDEMQLLSESNTISSVINFPSGSITFSILTNEENYHIDLIDDKCTLTIVKNDFLKLHQSEESTLTFTQKDLKVVFEKDFKCLTEREEDESNLFENPHTSH